MGAEGPARLTAGPLTAVLEDGQLLYLRYGDTEIVRRIYFALRDERWATVRNAVLDEDIQQDDNGFRVKYMAINEQGDICFQWRASIEASVSDGGQVDVRFHFSGQAETDFQTCRLGLCTLHAVDGFSNRKAQIETVDGGSEEGVFPDTIHPLLPFSNVRAMSYGAAGASDLNVRLQFNGDTFETEDQRQWGDASFKTYGRPQALPKPFEVTTGSTIEQSVELTVKPVSNDAPVVAYSGSDEVEVRVDPTETFALPSLGFVLPAGAQSHTGRERQRLESLKPGHFRQDLVPMRGSSGDEMAGAVEESKRFGVPIELAMWLSRSPQKELGRLIETLETYTPRMVGAILLPLLDDVLKGEVRMNARRVLKHTIPDVPIGVGTSTFFAEANRNRDVVEKAGFLCVPTSPATHLSDDRTLIENLPVPLSIAKTVASFAPDVPVVLGRVDLRPQPQPGTGTHVGKDELAGHVDPRQATMMCAAWTAVHLGMVARAGIERVTYFETTGPLGVMPSERGKPLPASFVDPEAVVFPVYHALADVADLDKPSVLGATSSQPLELGVLALKSGGRARVLLCNFGDKPRSVTLRGPADRGGVARMGADNLSQAMRNPERFRSRTPSVHTGGPIVVGPREIVRFDGEIPA